MLTCSVRHIHQLLTVINSNGYGFIGTDFDSDLQTEIMIIQLVSLTFNLSDLTQILWTSQ
jgi:hypothetical protein